MYYLNSVVKSVDVILDNVDKSTKIENILDHIVTNFKIVPLEAIKINTRTEYYNCY